MSFDLSTKALLSSSLSKPSPGQRDFLRPQEWPQAYLFRSPFFLSHLRLLFCPLAPNSGRQCRNCIRPEWHAIVRQLILDNPGQICRLKFTLERVSGQIKEMSRYLVGDGGFFKNACLRPYFFIFHVLCFPLNEWCFPLSEWCFPLNEWWQNAEQVIDEFPLSGSAFLIENPDISFIMEGVWSEPTGKAGLSSCYLNTY